MTDADGNITDPQSGDPRWLHTAFLKLTFRPSVGPFERSHHADEDSLQLVELTDLDLELRSAPIS